MSKTFSPTDHFWPSVVTERQSNLNRLTAEEAVLQPDNCNCLTCKQNLWQMVFPLLFICWFCLIGFNSGWRHQKNWKLYISWWNFSVISTSHIFSPVVIQIRMRLPVLFIPPVLLKVEEWGQFTVTALLHVDRQVDNLGASNEHYQKSDSDKSVIR